MRYLPNGSQMKEADKYTIQKLSVPSLTLMERAAKACVYSIKKREMNLSHICVVCGSGNNGGDGFAIARMFSEEGRRVTVVMAGNTAHLTKEASYQKKLFEETDGTLCDDLPEDEYSIIIDALFGVGLSREITGKYFDIIKKMNASAAHKVAVDIPSGISADTGMVLGAAFEAEVTVTFQTQKAGLLLYPGKKYAGEVVAADIGISEQMFTGSLHVACMPEWKEYQEMLPARREDSNKGTFGKLLIIAGSKGMSGAAYLNALGAYRMGAGLVRVYSPEENRTILQGQLPEAVITAYKLYDKQEIIELLEWADAVCIGSGIGVSEISQKILHTVAENVSAPCVVDADGLNLLAENKKYIKILRGKEVILTPHMKEFSRLTGKSVNEIRGDRMGILRNFVEMEEVTCILKDSATMILSPGGRICVNSSGCEAMAKAGSGDVLTGIVAGLLAQGAAVKTAGMLGAYLHGKAGEHAAAEKGHYSILAREIAERLGDAITELEGQI